MRQTRNEEDAERFKKQSVSPLAELYQKTHYRLARLKDGDAQLQDLIDLFESRGMPIGSDLWGRYCSAFVRRLLDEQQVLFRLLAQQQDPHEIVDWDRAKIGMDHAHKMYNKRKPKPGTECYCCGHDDATTTLCGYAICEICKLEHPDWENGMKQL